MGLGLRNFYPLSTRYSLVHNRADHSERECADTVGTVPVPWAGHFQAKVLIYFSNEINGSNFIKQHSKTVTVWNYQNVNYMQFKKKYCVIYYNFRQTFVPYLAPASFHMYHTDRLDARPIYQSVYRRYTWGEALASQSPWSRYDRHLNCLTHSFVKSAIQILA